MNDMKTDRKGHNDLYKDKDSYLISCTSTGEYIKRFEESGLSPYCKGGGTKGYVRGLSMKALLHSIEKSNTLPGDMLLLDAGCGQGELSVYLACLGFQVVGVDISEEACLAASRLAKAVGVADNCWFKAESLEKISLDENSVDYVIGFAALHHFIKYEGVSKEFNRILSNQGQMFFADSFGENRIYHVFHNKEQMCRLGDVILTRNLINQFFLGFDVELIPTDWFVMMDKVFLKFLPESAIPVIKKLSCFWQHIDRLIPINSTTLFFSGSCMTHVVKKECIQFALEDAVKISAARE